MHILQKPHCRNKQKVLSVWYRGEGGSKWYMRVFLTWTGSSLRKTVSFDAFSVTIGLGSPGCGALKEPGNQPNEQFWHAISHNAGKFNRWLLATKFCMLDRIWDLITHAPCAVDHVWGLGPARGQVSGFSIDFHHPPRECVTKYSICYAPQHYSGLCVYDEGPTTRSQCFAPTAWSIRCQRRCFKRYNICHTRSTLMPTWRVHTS